MKRVSDGAVIIVSGQGENLKMLSDLHIKWLEKRKIDLERATAIGVCSGRREPDGVYPDPDGDVLIFNYIRDGVDVGAKYRGANKTFWQKAGAIKQFYNRDILRDPAVISGAQPLLIVEGEMDALAVISAGYPFVVSVPDGAPPPRDGTGKLIAVPDGVEDLVPEHDTKFSFLLTDWDLLSKIPKIIIGADEDDAGARLTAELARRLDRIRCSFVTFPEDIKDWNDLLIHGGSETVLEAIKDAKPFPVEGIYSFDDLPTSEPIKTLSTGWAGVDEVLKPYLGAFMVVGGFPGHGKSTWTMQFASHMAANHGWGVAIASYEMQIVPYVTDSLMSAYLDANVNFATAPNREKARRFVQRCFTFIAPNRARVDVEHDIDWLIDKMTAAVIRNGVKMVLIDPFNEIEHRKAKDETLTEYIGRAIRKLKSFAMHFQVLVCVVVHPTKGSSLIDSADLSLYSLADSSHWANKADIGVIVGRIGNHETDTLTGIYTKKIRYQPDAGKIGQAVLNFNKDTRLFND
jgi:twinkle protein